jgi:hypothetical protein
MPANKSWHDYNESLIERGRVLIDLDFIKSSNKKIKLGISFSSALQYSISVLDKYRSVDSFELIDLSFTKLSF